MQISRVSTEAQLKTGSGLNGRASDARPRTSLASAPILGVFIDKKQAGAEPGGGIKEPSPHFDKDTLSF